ncbi:MAG: HAMP domain-containing protein [Myxococcales bacterium]|nr:HAMP domain-containing protein [Myxococcales bacterium]
MAFSRREVSIRLGLRAQLGAITAILAGVAAVSVGFVSLDLTRAQLVNERASQAVYNAPRIVEILTSDEEQRFPPGVVAAQLISGESVVAQQMPSDWSEFPHLSASGARRIELAGGDYVVVAHELVNGQRLAVVADLSDLDERMATATVATVLYAVLASLFVAIVGYLALTRLIVTPARRISLAAERVAAGDHASRVDVRSANEIGRMAESLNRMLDRLESGRLDLEQKVVALNKAHHELAQAQDAMIRGEKLATVGALAAGVAHEVGNPLSAILGMVEILNDESLSHDDRTDLLGRIEKELLRIHRIIGDLLNYSRPSGDGPAQADVPEVVQTVLKLVEAQPDFRDVHVTLTFEDSLPSVAAFPDRLVQVVLNLLINAADAVDGEGRVDVHAGRGQGGQVDEVWIRVSDDGPGVDDQQLKEIFRPFFSTKAPGKGTGLGLAICEQIVTSFGGRIWYEPGASSGATFVIAIPVLKSSRVQPGGGA